MKLSIPTEYKLTKEIKKCVCVEQHCSGKFLKLKHWQTKCPWETLRLKYAFSMDLNDNIYKNMNLTLTIQEIIDPESKKPFKATFMTLILDSHRKIFSNEMLDYAEKHAIYSAEIGKDINSPAIEPVKPQLVGINTVWPVSTVPGLEEIINDITNDAISLERQDKFKKMRASIKEKNEKNKQNA